MSYFKEFNFVRAVTLLSFLGALVLGYVVSRQHVELKAVRESIAPGGKIEKTSQDLQLLAKQFRQLDEQRQRDSSLDLKQPDAYVRKIGGQVYIAQIKVDLDIKNVGSQKDLFDHNLRLRPQDAKTSFQRKQLWEYFSRLEGENARLRVTSLRVSNAKTRVAPNEIPEDRWTFDATLTSRQMKSAN